MELLKKIWKLKDYILLGVIILLIMSCVNTCNNNSDLQRDINRQHNNIAAITDTLKQYKYSPRTKDEMIGLYDFLKETKE